MTHDETSRPLVMGEGRISGYLSIALGVLSSLAVLCLRFPQYLTTPLPDYLMVPSVEPSRGLVVVRALLFAGMGLSAAFGLLTFVLNRQKKLGALGISLSLAALLLGSAAVQAGPRYGSGGYIGLDWFVVDVIMSGAIFIFLEKIAPRIREQAILRPGFWHDARYFIFNHLAISIFLFAGAVAVPSLFVWTVNADLQAGFHKVPDILQFVIILLTADVMEYGIHRAMHEIPWLWKFHAVHHSVQHMDWLAGSRLHVLEPLFTRSLVLLPAFVLGADKVPMLCYIVFAAFQSGLIHANFGMAFGPFKYLLCTPQFHHWHHSSEREAIDTNYAAHLPVIDRLFGTYHMPAGRWPTTYGVVGDPLPQGMIRQFLYPFRRK